MPGKKLLTLSDLLIIAPLQINPQAEEAAQLAKQYCDELGITLSGYKDYTTMSRYLYPRTDAQRLALVDLFMNLLWFIDDSYSDNDYQMDKTEEDRVLGVVYKNCAEIMRTGELPATPHVMYDACLFLHDQILNLSCQEWLDRLSTNFYDHIASTRVTTRGPEPIMTDGKFDEKKYVELRKYDSGMYPTMDFIEFTHNIYLPDEVFEHPTIKRLLEDTAMYGLTTNDVFSYHKEVVVGGTCYNLVNVLVESRGYTLEEAVHECIMRSDTYLCDFLDIEKRLPTFGDAKLDRDVRKYVQGLKDQLIASWYWQINTNRYRHPDQIFPELRELLD